MQGGASDTQYMLLAETLGLAMARRAWDILERHRAAMARGGAGARAGRGAGGGSLAGLETGADPDDDQFALDNAVFSAVLDAANECLGRFDTRPADDRWCDALLQIIHLGQLGM